MSGRQAGSNTARRRCCVAVRQAVRGGGDGVWSWRGGSWREEVEEEGVREEGVEEEGVEHEETEGGKDHDASDDPQRAQDAKERPHEPDKPGEARDWSKPPLTDKARYCSRISCEPGESRGIFVAKPEHFTESR